MPSKPLSSPCNQAPVENTSGRREDGEIFCSFCTILFEVNVFLLFYLDIIVAPAP